MTFKILDILWYDLLNTLGLDKMANVYRQHMEIYFHRTAIILKNISPVCWCVYSFPPALKWPMIYFLTILNDILDLILYFIINISHKMK